MKYKIYLKCEEGVQVSCYHPNLMFKTDRVDQETGKPIYQFMPAASQRRDLFDHIKEYDVMLIPCGKCVGCRLDYSRSWADRMMLEYQVMKKAIFLTLTYNNEHIPVKEDGEGNLIGYTVSKRDVQLFMKRLRRKYEDRTLKFYLSSEYGPKTKRPHYHAIIFGIGIDELPKIPHGMNELKQQYYELPSIQEIWSEYDDNGNRVADLGYVLGSDVNYRTCAYVSRYVMKKVRDDQTWSKETGVDPEFTLMSRNPGIGYSYLREHEDCLDLASVSIPDPDSKEGQKKIMIPKYFIRQLSREGSDKCPNDLYNPGKYDMICSQRKELADDKVLRILKSTSLSYLDQLEVEEEHKLRSVAALKRGDL